MHVLQVDTATEWRGGQVQVLHLVQGMVDRGVLVTVACPRAGRLWAALESTQVERIDIPAGWSLRTAMKVARTNADILAVHTSHGHGSLAMLRRPLVVHRHVDFVPSGGWKYRRPDAYVAVSQGVADVLSAAGASSIHVVHCGVEFETVDWAAEDAPTVLAVGARVAHKGHQVLAEAAKQLEGVDIAVAGEGPLTPDGLRWLGHRDDVPALLAGAKVFVQPSVEEGLGTAAVEAMLAGVPVVATDAGGLPEVVGDQGILVPRGDASALAGGIERALAGDHPRIETARDHARNRFGVSRMVDETIEVYRTVA